MCEVQCSTKLIHAPVQCFTKLIRLAISVWGPVLYQAHSGLPSACEIQCSTKLIQARVQCSTKLIQACHQHVRSSTLSSSFKLGSSAPTMLIQACRQCMGSSTLSSSFRLTCSALSSSFRLAISMWGAVLYQAISYALHHQILILRCRVSILLTGSIFVVLDITLAPTLLATFKG